jgi:hypothetical protein
MYQDEIIAEVWRNRDVYAKQHQYNLAEIVADLQQRQQQTNHTVIDRRKPSTQKHTTENAQTGKSG